MPNWCLNRLAVAGDDERVWELLSRSAGLAAPTLGNLMGRSPSEVERHAFVVSVVEGAVASFSLSGCVPMPSELAGTSSPSNASEEERARLVSLYGADDWYSWSVQHWGTKWDAADVSVCDVAPGRVALSFDTAWSPPEPWVATVSSQFPDLTFTLEFFEPGVDVEGWASFVNGDLVDEGNELGWAQELRDEWSACEQADAAAAAAGPFDELADS
jgi:hypothetical protein